MDGQLWTISEAAHYLRMSYGSVRDWVSIEKLGRATIGGTIILSDADVMKIGELKRRVGRPSKPSPKKGAKA